MSSRRSYNKQPCDTADQLRHELYELKEQCTAINTGAQVNMGVNAAFDSLSGTEQAAGSLGVQPDAWNPIKFMNNAHYEQLIASNSLDDNLARRIEVREPTSGTTLTNLRLYTILNLTHSPRIV